MDFETFVKTYSHLKDVDQVCVDDLCDHPEHLKTGKQIGKAPAKRNILKHDKKQFICRECMMKHDNPMVNPRERRATDEIITVICPNQNHSGSRERQMARTSYYGANKEPYEQECGSCSQTGRVQSEQTKQTISDKLDGIVRSDDFKKKLSDYMKGNQEGIERGKANLKPGFGAGWNKGQETPEEVKQKISEANTGKVRTPEQRQNISDGRKAMLNETGGFTQTHRENISKAVVKMYQEGFNPRTHHLRAWHDSPKVGSIFHASSYEKKAFMVLDEDSNIKSYRREVTVIPFQHPEKNILASYLIDLEVTYSDDTIGWIEIKPLAWVDDIVVMAKTQAAEAAAKDLGLSFKIWTEVDLFGPMYNSKNIETFVQNLRAEISGTPVGEHKKEANRKKALKYYHNNTATDRVDAWCDYCNETHDIMRSSYEENIFDNGRYICRFENGHITGSSTRPPKNIEPVTEKECAKCHEVKNIEEYGIDKSRSDGRATKCKDCRSKNAKSKYVPKERQDRERVLDPNLVNGQKKCSGCNEIKNVEEFNVDNSRPDNLNIYCKSCRSTKKE